MTQPIKERQVIGIITIIVLVTLAAYLVSLQRGKQSAEVIAATQNAADKEE